MSLSFPSAGIYLTGGGADPLVRAGPPGPALSPTKSDPCNDRKPTRASAADPGVRPTSLISIGKTKWHWDVILPHMLKLTHDLPSQ
jgi:hypothetical protein